MKLRLILLVAAALAGMACNNLPGRPGPDPEVPRPDDVLNFKILFQQNCSGCHGPDGKGGVSIPLSNPLYLAIADDNTIRKVITAGVHGFGMPAFARSSGGILTDKQIDVIVGGIRGWAGNDPPKDSGLPPYAASAPGDATHGNEVFTTFCSSCHGSDGNGGKGGSSIVNGAYLALVSDQYLRTVVIAGRPDIGQPDFRSDAQGHPMAPQEITDVVAWLTAQRPQYPGQPYSAKAYLPTLQEPGK